MATVYKTDSKKMELKLFLATIVSKWKILLMLLALGLVVGCFLSKEIEKREIEKKYNNYLETKEQEAVDEVVYSDSQGEPVTYAINFSFLNGIVNQITNREIVIKANRNYLTYSPLMRSNSTSLTKRELIYCISKINTSSDLDSVRLLTSEVESLLTSSTFCVEIGKLIDTPPQYVSELLQIDKEFFEEGTQESCILKISCIGFDNELIKTILDYIENQISDKYQNNADISASYSFELTDQFEHFFDDEQYRNKRYELYFDTLQKTQEVDHIYSTYTEVESMYLRDVVSGNIESRTGSETYSEKEVEWILENHSFDIPNGVIANDEKDSPIESMNDEADASTEVIDSEIELKMEDFGTPSVNLVIALGIALLLCFVMVGIYFCKFLLDCTVHSTFEIEDYWEFRSFSIPILRDGLVRKKKNKLEIKLSAWANMNVQTKTPEEIAHDIQLDCISAKGKLKKVFFIMDGKNESIKWVESELGLIAENDNDIEVTFGKDVVYDAKEHLNLRNADLIYLVCQAGVSTLESINRIANLCNTDGKLIQAAILIDEYRL